MVDRQLAVLSEQNRARNGSQEKPVLMTSTVVAGAKNGKLYVMLHVIVEAE
jgi:hypothetical protein